MFQYDDGSIKITPYTSWNQEARSDTIITFNIDNIGHQRHLLIPSIIYRQTGYDGVSFSLQHKFAGETGWTQVDTVLFGEAMSFTIEANVVGEFRVVTSVRGTVKMVNNVPTIVYLGTASIQAQPVLIQLIKNGSLIS